MKGRILFMRAFTGHADIDEVLAELGDGIASALGDNLVGFYLTGSLTYGDFDRGSSDIDYLVAMHREIEPDERNALRLLHDNVGRRFPMWRERIEGTYVTLEMLERIDPPEQGRPYVNQGAFWEPDPPYGNEWLLNLFVLRQSGVALIGPEPGDIFPDVDIEDVRLASARDLFDERLPTVEDLAMYEEPHQQAYTVLTICRILHRHQHDEVVSKRVASAWVKREYGEPWASLVERAEQWSYGKDLAQPYEVTAFIRFAADVLSADSG
jgi:hypothetical protein